MGNDDYNNDPEISKRQVSNGEASRGSGAGNKLPVCGPFVGDASSLSLSLHRYIIGYQKFGASVTTVSSIDGNFILEKMSNRAESVTGDKGGM